MWPPRPPGFSVHGISQARILEWLAISFSITLLAGMQNIVAIVQNYWRFLKKLKNRTTVWPRNPTLIYISQKNWNQDLKEVLAFSCSLQHDTNSVSITGWMDKENVVYTYNGMFSHKNEGNPEHITTELNLEDIMLIKISQPQKDKSLHDSL